MKLMKGEISDVEVPRQTWVKSSKDLVKEESFKGRNLKYYDM